MNVGCILMDRNKMRDEYDFSNGQRGLFYRPGTERKYVITLDHRPQSGRFEIYSDDKGVFNYRLKSEDGETLLSKGPFASRDDAMDAVAKLRDTVIGAEAVEAV